MCAFKIDNLNLIYSHIIIMLITKQNKIYKQPLLNCLTNNIQNNNHE